MGAAGAFLTLRLWPGALAPDLHHPVQQNEHNTEPRAYENPERSEGFLKVLMSKIFLMEIIKVLKKRCWGPYVDAALSIFSAFLLGTKDGVMCSGKPHLSQHPAERAVGCTGVSSPG